MLRRPARERAARAARRATISAGDVDERPHVLVRRRRVHDDDAAAARRDRRAGSGESWHRSTPAAGVAAIERRGARRPREPGGEGVRARRRRPRRSRQATERIHGQRRCGVRGADARARVDNRFYKPMRDRSARPSGYASSSRCWRCCAASCAPHTLPLAGRLRALAKPRLERVAGDAARAAASPPARCTRAARAATAAQAAAASSCSARELRGRPDLDASAEGDVEFRRGGRS